MRIIAYYNSQRINESLSNLAWGGNVVELEDAVDKINSGIGVLYVLKDLYEKKKIKKYPVECVEKSCGIYRVKFGDVLGNSYYMELRKEI